MLHVDTDTFCYKISKATRRPQVHASYVSFALQHVPVNHRGNVLRGCARYIQSFTGINAQVHFGHLKIPEDETECIKMFFNDTRDDHDILHFIIRLITKIPEICRLVHLDRKGRRRSSNSWPYAFIFQNYLFHYSDKEMGKTLKRVAKRHGCLGYKTIISKKKAKMVVLGQCASLFAGQQFLPPEVAVSNLFKLIFKKRLLSASDLFRKSLHHKNTGFIKPLKDIPMFRNTKPPKYTAFVDWLKTGF